MTSSTARTAAGVLLSGVSRQGRLHDGIILSSLRQRFAHTSSLLSSSSSSSSTNSDAIATNNAASIRSKLSSTLTELIPSMQTTSSAASKSSSSFSPPPSTLPSALSADLGATKSKLRSFGARGLITPEDQVWFDRWDVAADRRKANETNKKTNKRCDSRRGWYWSTANWRSHIVPWSASVSLWETLARASCRSMSSSRWSSPLPSNRFLSFLSFLSSSLLQFND